MISQYSIILIGMWLLALCYVRMRDRIEFSKREIFEKFLMILIMIALIFNVTLLIYETKTKTGEVNDCIRFYRYFPNSGIDDEFYFIKEKCFKMYNEEEIEMFKKSGREWNKEQLGKRYLIPDLNIGE